MSLADTVGYANPAQIRAVVRAVRAAIGDRLEKLHLHDTMGLGLANALAGLEEGIRDFDAALAGLGGCPFAPGASGNIVTEDLVFMLESMGFSTGIDLRRLIAARALLHDGACRTSRCTARCRAPASRRPSAPPPDPTVHAALPLAGIRVVEFAHMVMGPTCGLVLADLGADVIKVEPAPDGDNTRRLGGSGAGFFAAGQPQQAQPRGRSEGGRRHRAGAPPAGERRRAGGEFPPRCDGQARPRLGRAARAAIRGWSIAPARASCPARTSTAWRSTRWCR